MDISGKAKAEVTAFGKNASNQSSAAGRGCREDALRIGVAGCGYWGSKHVRVLNGIAEVDAVAVIERDARIRTAISRAFPAVRGFAELDEALDEIDALVIATPPSSHAKLALAAIEAGSPAYTILILYSQLYGSFEPVRAPWRPLDSGQGLQTRRCEPVGRPSAAVRIS